MLSQCIKTSCLSVFLGPEVVKQEKNTWPEIVFDALQGGLLVRVKCGGLISVWRKRLLKV